MSRALDLVGQRFGRLTVLFRTENNAHGNTRWLCQCDCGQQKIFPAGKLRDGRAKSCGCEWHNGAVTYVPGTHRIDLTGQRFGRLVVLSQAGQNSSRGIMWQCQCDCGQSTIVHSDNLRRGHTVSCGCLQLEETSKAKRIPVEIGQRFSRLVVLAETIGSNNSVEWLCRCDCGNTHQVTSYELRFGAVQSCGCLVSEVQGQLAIRNPDFTTLRHGHARHGQLSPTYSSWLAMHKRVKDDDPNSNHFKYYYAEGVTVEDKDWFRFENFLADMNERPDGKTLDRVDPYGNYKPDNCRWATPKEQIANRRKRKAKPESR